MRKKLFYYVGLPLGVLLVALLLSYVALIFITARMVAAEHAKIRAAGDPLFLTEYAREPIPDEQNAYYFLLLAADDLTRFDEEVGELDDGVRFTERLGQYALQEQEAVVAKYPQMYDLLRKAAACPHFDCHPDYSLHIDVDTSYLKLCRAAARALNYKAVVLSERGQGDAALEVVGTAIQLANHLSDEPLLVPQLENVADFSIAAHAANYVLCVAPTSAKARSKLLEIIRTEGEGPSLTNTLKGERAATALFIREARAGRVKDAESSKMYVDNWLYRAYLNANEANYLSMASRIIDAIELPEQDRDREFENIELEINSKSPLLRFARGFLVPSVSTTASVLRRRTAQLRCLQLVLELEEHGSVDRATLDLPSELLIDPFNQDELIIKKTDDGWIAYSVGPNGTDDGGFVDMEDDDWFLHGDVGFGPLRPAAESEQAEEEQEVVE